MRKLLLSIALILFVTSAASTASFKIVVNKDNPTSSLTRAEVAGMLMKKQRQWADGTPVVPVDLSANSTVRAAMSTAIHGRNTAAIRSFWQQQIFSGRDVPPVEKTSDDQVLAFVRANRGAIGYVSDTTATEGVKVITVQ